ncbi:MAG: glycosyltransferase family 4 protein [Acidobacteriaceae bacterium]|nr:glycosyltransferase family 4 protein [Acidobacteriaceae bacterium]
MRLLHIDTGREMRGGQKQVLLLLKALVGAGHDCALLTPRESPLRREIAFSGVAVHDATLFNVCKLAGAADLVHAHDAKGHTLAALAARTPVVVSRRVAFPVGRSLASRWKYSRAARFAAVSRFVAEELYRAGIAKKKVDVVYDAVEETTVENRWSARAPAIALASRDPMKGRDLVELAAKRANTGVFFSEDLSRDLQNASMFLYITRSEGLGSAALLAMRMGVPVVASRVGGLTEIFEDGVSGIYVENDSEQIAAAMRKLTAEPEFACRLIREGRKRVAARFTIEHLLAATVNCYTRALGG